MIAIGLFTTERQASGSKGPLRMAPGGRRLVGLTVWGDGKVYESLDRPGELSFDVTGAGPDGRPMEVLLGDDDKGVRFFDLSTDPPKLLPIGEWPRNRGSSARRFYTKEGGQRRYFDDLLPPGRLPGQPLVDQTVGVANGGGATLRQRQEGSSLSQQQTANSSSVGRRTGTLPSGAQYEVVQEGTGRVPTPNDRVKFDDIEWVDGFNGRDKFVDYRGRVDRVSDLFFAWEGDAVLSMREGETRQITLPPGYIARYIQLRLISIE
ncbi:unnamed protein product [Vitrella brassicaformis CCMP3155]|uniref:Uncharacterized protein n=1 Tax=Vitrella brassicaformis (strain CCMP3155) TaxID=1169540 RepID=A0A0G4H4W6_VITBC|nr:unnamed protein product [Vitrella brassicaformis CCMP3155]|eukprot:CEM38720.1 unnamed protein product [Vitrella brassicaformis CCMP3155]